MNLAVTVSPAIGCVLAGINYLLLCIIDCVVSVIATVIVFNAPEDMRGRYMAASHLGWGIAASVGPLTAGIIVDNYNPNWVWYTGGIICSIIALGYFILKTRVGDRFHSLAM